jgi:hypothetical protein
MANVPTHLEIVSAAPSPELTLKLLGRQGQGEFGSSGTGGTTRDKEREHMFQYLEETELPDDEVEVSDGTPLLFVATES